MEKPKYCPKVPETAAKLADMMILGERQKLWRS